MPSTLVRSPHTFRVVLLATVVSALLPAGLLRWTSDIADIARLPLAPFGDGANAVMAWLRPPPSHVAGVPDEARPFVEPLIEQKERLEQKLRAAEHRIDELAEELRQLQQVALIASPVPTRPVNARVTLRNPTEPHGVIELKGGTRLGIEPGAVAVFGGVHIVGRIIESTPIVSRLLPITSADSEYITAVVLPPDDVDTPLASAPRIHLEPAGDGTLVAEYARTPQIARGYIVRLSDNDWAASAQQRVIGTIESITVKDEDLLVCSIVVRPAYQAHQLSAVTLLVESRRHGRPDDRRPAVRWPVFAVFALVALVYETSLRQALVLHAAGGVSPSLMAPLVVFAALFAPRTTVLWAAWFSGLLMDLCPPPPAHAPTVQLVGPYALGYVLAAYLVIQLRPMVFRRRALTVGALTFVGLAAAGLLSVAILTVRSWYPEATVSGVDFRPLVGLARRLGDAVYSGLLAIPLGAVLMMSHPVWGFREGRG